MKLEIELVPQPLWFINLRKAMGTKAWDLLRKEVYAAYNQQCGLCAASGRLECHERWSYTLVADAAIQTLLGFIALCPMCHHCKHIGMAGILARKGVLDFEDVIAHFMKVNNCTRVEYEAHSAAQWQLWQDRSRPEIVWTFDYGEYQDYAPKK